MDTWADKAKSACADLGRNLMERREFSFQEIVEWVCRRPAMYTLGGSYNEVIAFLEGYDGAIARYAPGAERGFAGFHEWLRARLPGPRNRIAWADLRDACATEEEALERFRAYYAEFLAEERPSL